MGELSDFEVGQTVEVQDGRIAIVQFIGSTDFAAGDWIGVVLDDATGKNDGSVKGQRYFTCKPAHGMFVRPSAASIIDQPTPKAKAPPRLNGTGAKGRPLSLNADKLRRQSVLDPGTTKRQSINAASPTPSSRAGGAATLASPGKSPTKQLRSRTSSGNVSSSSAASTNTKPTLPANKASRMSMAPPSISSGKPSRPSIAGTMNGSAKPSSNGSFAGSRGLAGRMSMRPTVHNRLISAGGRNETTSTNGHISPPESVHQGLLSPASQISENEARGPLSSSLSGSSALSPSEGSRNIASSRGRSPPKQPNRAPSANTREAEDLRTKIRVLEKKRQEDREKIKALEKVQGERDKFEVIIQKLQSKYQPQQQEIAELRKQLQDEEARMRSLEVQQAENDTLVEVATLDREMAEETAESLKTELEALRQKHQEIELEVEILREENQELGKEMSPEEKTSQGWLQMERSNERLREALMRLRDVTQQQESDLRAQVQELQNDLQDLSGVKDEYLNTKENFAQSEAIIEDLRQQLETALGAEEMIEELTEKNFALSQKAEKLEADIEELENLKEISDEIEINHTETEKQLQDEVDYTESMLAEQKRQARLQDETIQDLEYTVTRFQDLVTMMQSDLQEMRASQQITETEANELNDRAKAMTDINLKLQVSASKAQTKAIDIELGRMEAQEAAEHLSIIQRFLPDSLSGERNSVLAFLRFRRVGFKAKLMHGLIKERIHHGHSLKAQEDVFTCCEILEKLTWILCMCDRFIQFIQRCTLDSFEKLAGALYDLEPVERAFSGWIEALSKEGFQETQCVEDLGRSIALMAHLGEVHISEGLEQHADEIHMRALMLQSHLESAAIALDNVKSMTQPDRIAGGADVEDDDDAQRLIRKTDDLISQIRSAKVVSGKAIRHLEDLGSRSLTLDQTTVPIIDQTQTSTSEISLSIRTVGISVAQILSEEGRAAPPTYPEIIAAISQDSTPLSSLSSKITSTLAHLQTYYGITSSLTQTVELPSPPPPPPWQLLSLKLRNELNAAVNQEAEHAQLKNDAKEKDAVLAMRDKALEEMVVKVEVLEKRVGESGGRREQVKELENALRIAKTKEKDLSSKLVGLRKDFENLEGEREQWKTASAASGERTINKYQDHAANVPTSAATVAQIQLLKTQITTLESTIRYLRRQNHGQHIKSSLEFLDEPLTLPRSPSQSLLQTEARDVLKEMLHLVTQPQSQLVKLNVPERMERLKWKPVKETAAWQTSIRREEWESWRAWRDDVSKRSRYKSKPIPDVRNIERANQTIAKLQMRLPYLQANMKGEEQEVKIVRAGEWDDLHGMAGFNAA